MDLANPSCRNIQEWVTHLNDGIKYLTFRIIGQSHMVHFVDSLISIDSTVTQKGFTLPELAKFNALLLMI
jgi:hypothetical protein